MDFSAYLYTYIEWKEINLKRYNKLAGLGKLLMCVFVQNLSFTNRKNAATF